METRTAYLVLFGANDSCYGRIYKTLQDALKDTNTTESLVGEGNGDISYSLEEYEGEIDAEVIYNHMKIVENDLISVAYSNGYKEVQTVLKEIFWDSDEDLEAL